jgi:hypothetical protein
MILNRDYDKYIITPLFSIAIVHSKKKNQKTHQNTIIIFTSSPLAFLLFFVVSPRPKLVLQPLCRNKWWNRHPTIKIQSKVIALSLSFIGFIIELINFKFWLISICVVFDNQVFYDVKIILDFKCCNYVFLIQLMLFMESIRFELEKLRFKLIIRLLVVFNNIVWIEIYFVLIDTIR